MKKTPTENYGLVANRLFRGSVKIMKINSLSPPRNNQSKHRKALLKIDTSFYATHPTHINIQINTYTPVIDHR